MKRVYGFLFMLSLWLGTTNVSLAQTPCTVSDDFNDGVADGWSPLTSGRWQVSNDAGSLRYFLNTSNYESPDGIRMGEISLVSNFQWNDFNFECIAKSVDALQSNENADLCVAFGYQDFDSYYYINFNRAPGVTQLFRIHNGAPAVALATYNQGTFVDGSYHAIRVERTGSQLRAYFDGTLILSANDSFFGLGGIGIGSYNDSGYFDNVTITPCPSGSADLVADRIYLRSGPNITDPEVTQPIAGQQYYVHFDWRNTGTTAANNFRVENRFNGSVLCAAPSQSAPANSNFITRCTAEVITWPAGTNTIEGSLDVNNSIPEANESNNIVSQTYNTTGTVDLVADRIYLRSGPNITDPEITQPVAGQQYYVHFDWRNTGTTAVNNFRVENRFNGSVLCAVASQSAPANSSFITRCTAEVITWPAGTNTLEGRLDVNNSISESNESNNIVSQTYNTAGTVDLVADRIYLRSGPNTTDPIVTQPVAGQQYYVHFDWRNTGTATANNFRVENRFNGSVLCAAPSQSAPANSNFITRCTAEVIIWSAGTNTIEGRLDVNNVIGETNENNNILSQTYTAVSIGEIKPVVAATQPIGAEFTVDVTVGNVQNFFGVSFELNYTNTVFIDVVPPATAGSFLGNDVVFVSNIDEASGKVSIGITRKTGQGGVSGSGTIAQVKFKSLLTTPADIPVVFSLSNVAASDPTGAGIVLTTSMATTILKPAGVTVWPGDTNNDNIANQADVLHVGLHWNRSGPTRVGASSQWIGQFATFWSPQAATFADADGNGFVDQADLLPIGLNWEKTHTSLAPNNLGKTTITNQTAAALLRLTPVGDITPGQEFWVELRAEQAANLFGNAFELRYTPATLVEPQAAEAGNFFGADVISYSNIDRNSGKISMGISRKAGQAGVNGAGVIAKIKMRLASGALPGQMVTLTLHNVVANDHNGHVITATAAPGQFAVGSIASRINELAPETFALHPNTPNPFWSAAAGGAFTQIQYELPQPAEVQIEILDMLGKRVRLLLQKYQLAGRYAVAWDGRDEHGRDLASGVFIYQMRAGIFLQSRKLLLLR